MDHTQKEFYEQSGYLILEDYASESEINELIAAKNEIVENMVSEELSIFSTEDQSNKSDLYFLNSGDKIRCFFEETATEDDLIAKKKINKIGHAIHDLNPVYRKFSYQQKLADLAILCGLSQPSILQSQYIFKSPQVGGVVSAHIDSTFIYTDPLSCVGVWIALEDANQENGCLWALPESHNKYPMNERFVRNESNDGTEFLDLKIERAEWDLDAMIPLEVKKGTAIVLHGSLVHLSHPNHSNRSRNSYVMHLIDRACAYPQDNWLQRGVEMPLVDLISEVG